MFLEKNKKSGDVLHDANMTPLIDVSLVLVVMLLLLTPLAFESSIALRKSAGARDLPAAKERAQAIELNIVSEDSVKVGAVTVGRKALGTFLPSMMEEEGCRQVSINCNGDVSHGAFVNVVDQAKLSGAAGIAVVGR